jgi:hypothetical protein
VALRAPVLLDCRKLFPPHDNKEVPLTGYIYGADY